MEKNHAWVKIFYNCSVDQYGLIKEVKEKVLTNSVMEKSEFLDRILEVNPEMNPNQMYFEFKKMRVAGLIKELPKKNIGLDHKLILELKGEFDGLKR